MDQIVHTQKLVVPVLMSILSLYDIRKKADIRMILQNVDFFLVNHLQVFATTMGGNSLFKGVTLFWQGVTVSCSRGNKPNRIISSEL